MRSIRRPLTRALSFLRRTPLPSPCPGPLLPQNELVDEETCPGYDSRRFHPAKPGDVLGDRFQFLVKVGWGVSSTVWFARDLRGSDDEPEKAVALKLSNANRHIADEDDERAVEEHIAKADPSQRGRALFRTFSESFEVAGPEGQHLCLAYEPMREPFWLLQSSSKMGGVAHTDLKLENIMVTFEDTAVLGDFMNAQLEEPMAYKIDVRGRAVYRYVRDFGTVRNVRRIIPKIVDFGAAIRFDDADDRFIHLIQPDHYRAPEVTLGCGWGMSADIWNMGVLLWGLIQGKELFRNIHDPQGRYDAKAHLAEMIDLFGPPPPDLIAKYHSMREYKWPYAVQSEDGTMCETAEQYFGGPFFDEDGKFLYPNLRPEQSLRDTLPPTLEANERERLRVICADDGCLAAGGEEDGWRTHGPSIFTAEISG